MITTSKHDPALFRNIIKCVLGLAGFIILLCTLYFSGMALLEYVDTNLNYFYENISPIIYIVMGIMGFIFFTTLCCKEKTPKEYESTHNILSCVMGILGTSLVLLTFLVFAVHSSYRERNYHCEDKYSYNSILPQSECTRITK